VALSHIEHTQNTIRQLNCS